MSASKPVKATRLSDGGERRRPPNLPANHKGLFAMSKELPRFRKIQRRYAAAIIRDTLSGPRGSALLQLIEHDDHHFRAIFDSKFFQLPAGKSEPSKSQWNTLKKRLKRRDRSILRLSPIWADRLRQIRYCAGGGPMLVS